ncbi:MAG: helix-turn-helix transcriptional regulator [Clostridia bacterium]
MKTNNIIKNLREEKELSQLELAEKIESSQSAIAKWELGKTEPTTQYLIKLADFFKVSADYLIGRENDVTGNVEIKGELLSNTEHELIIIFRRLPEKEKYRALGIIQGLAS